MKLKTLKDLFNEGYIYEIKVKKTLKQEAIKWVKEMREIKGLCITADTAFNEFFNIKEENLKDA